MRKRLELNKKDPRATEAFTSYSPVAETSRPGVKGTAIGIAGGHGGILL